MDKTEIQKQGFWRVEAVGGGGRVQRVAKVLYFLEAIFVIFDCVDDSICNHHFLHFFFFFYLLCLAFFTQTMNVGGKWLSRLSIS